MKILHVLTSPRAEGTPRLVLDWLRTGLHEQSVLFLKSKPIDLIDEFNSVSKDIYYSNIDYSKQIGRTVGIFKTVKKVVKDKKPDLVISWNQGYANFIVLGARFGGSKNNVVHVGCAPESGKFGHFFDYYVYWPVAFLGGKAVCASNHIKSIFDSFYIFPRYIFKTIPNYVCFEKFYKKSQSYSHNKKAIIVGNLEITKNHAFLLQSWKSVVEKLPFVELTIVGRGSLMEELKGLSQNLGISSNVTFLGARNDVPELLWEHSLFLFTSTKNEGFGTVLIEALSACLKIVSISERASREVLKDGKYGILVRTDDPTAFAEVIVEAFANPLTSTQILNQIDYAKTFSPETMIQEYVNYASRN